MLKKLLAGKALAAIGVVALTASGAAAATGSLPDPAQDYVLTVHARTLYYSAPDGGGFVIRKVPVPAACE